MEKLVSSLLVAGYWISLADAEFAHYDGSRDLKNILDQIERSKNAKPIELWLTETDPATTNWEPIGFVKLV